MFVPKSIRSGNAKRAALIISVPVGMGLVLNAGLAMAGSESDGPGRGGGQTLTQSPSGEVTTSPPPATTKPPVTEQPTTDPPNTSEPPTTDPPETSEPPTSESPTPEPSTSEPSTTEPPTTEPPTTAPPTTRPPTTEPPTTRPPTTTTPPTTQPPVGSAQLDVAVTSRRIVFDANGRSTISFTVANTTDETRSVRDVWAYSTRDLDILSVSGPGCQPWAQLADPGPAWASSFRCDLPALQPNESRSWTASVQYKPAIRTGSAPRAGRDQVRLPLADAANLSTFCVLVVPDNAVDTSVVLGRAGPLTLIEGEVSGPTVIGYTLAVGGGPGATIGGDTGTTTSGATGGDTGGDATGGATTSGNAGPTDGGSIGGGDDDTSDDGKTGATGSTTTGSQPPATPTTLPNTGAGDDSLSLAGGALGLILVGNALFRNTRLRRVRSAESDETTED